MILDQSLEAERAVLGALLIDAAAIDALDRFDPGWCFLAAHQEIGRAIFQLHRERKTVDVVTVHSALQAQGKVPDPVPAEMVFALGSGVGTSSGVRHYAGVVQNAWSMRQARILAKRFVEDPDALSAEAAIGAFQRDLALLMVGGGDKIITAGEILAELIERLEHENRGAPGTELVSSGFSAVDDLTGGFTAGVPHLYAARTHNGKTALAMAYAAALGRAGVPTAVFWWEDAKRTFGARLAALEALIPRAMLRHGRAMRAPWWVALQECQAQVAKWPLYVEPKKGVSAREVVQRLRKLKREKDVRVIIADHLGEMKLEADRGERYDLMLGGAVREVRDESDRLGICAVLFHQLGRKAEIEAKSGPRLGWLENSGALEQVARTVGFLSLHTPEEGAEDQRAKMLVTFLKGPPGRVVELGWDEEHLRVFEPQPDRMPVQGDLV